MGGMLTCAFSLFGVIDIFNAALEPLEYMMNFYQLFFGLLLARRGLGGCAAW